MIKDSVYRKSGVERSEYLPCFAWPGGYGLVYYCEDNGIICPACVNCEDSFKTEDDPQWNVVDVDVYWEGQDMYCDNCNDKIESAYGDPDVEME